MSSFEINLTDEQIVDNRKQTKKAMDFYQLLWKSAELVHDYVGKKPSLSNVMLDKLNTSIEQFKSKYDLHRAEEGALIGMAPSYLLYGANKHRSVDTPQLQTKDPYTPLQKKIIHPEEIRNHKEYLKVVQAASRLLRRFDGRQLAELLNEVDVLVIADQGKVQWWQTLRAGLNPADKKVSFRGLRPRTRTR